MQNHYHQPSKRLNKEICSIRLSLFYYLSSILLCMVIIYLVYYPEIYNFLTAKTYENLFLYVNAWDEETYMSYFGSIGARTIPGYYPLVITTSLHKLNLSGSEQNLIFDLLLIPSTILLTTLYIANFTKKETAFAYAIVVLFSSVLFNYCNPLIASIYGERHLTTIVAGFENYPSFIRAPNPLFSYFTVSFCLYLSQKKQKKSILLVPPVVLYYFVFQPYVYCLLTFYLNSVINKKEHLLKNLLINLFSFIFISLIGYLAYHHLLLPSQTEIFAQLINTPHLEITRKIYLPIYTIIASALTLIVFVYPIEEKTTQNRMFTLTLCTFFISNIQILTNFAIEIKNFQDYGNGLIIGVIIVFFLEYLKMKQTIPIYLNQLGSRPK